MGHGNPGKSWNFFNIILHAWEVMKFERGSRKVMEND